MSSDCGFFRIGVYKKDGSPDKAKAKEVFDWLKANCKWFIDGSDEVFDLRGNELLTHGSPFSEGLDVDEFAEDPFNGRYVPGNLDFLDKASVETKAETIVAEGSEIKKETILNILSLCNKKVMAYALAGYNYSNEVEQMTPRVNGVFEDINAQFDLNIHKCVIDITAGAAQNMQGRRFAYCGTRALRHIAVPPPCPRYSRPRQSAILTA